LASSIDFGIGFFNTVICGLAFARIKSSKFEVSNSTHYVDTKGDKKCGGLG